MYFYYSPDGNSGSGGTLAFNWTPTINTWHHIALVRSGDNLNFYVDGVKNATTRPTVYHEIWSDPYMSIGKGTFVDEVIKLAGGQNIFENATTDYPIVSSEAIIEQNPDIIVFPTQMGVESFWGDFETVANRPGWSSINAVKNNKMYAVNGDIIDEPGPRQVDALEILAKIIHPEIFGTYTGTS
jgi:iron complex transport system substrate-binding protein